MSLLIERTSADEIDKEIFFPLESFLHDEILNERDDRYFSKGKRFQKKLSRLIRDLIDDTPKVDVAVAEYVIGTWPSEDCFVRYKMGPTVFYHGKRSVAEIDLLAEYRSKDTVVPMIFEFTLSGDGVPVGAKSETVRKFYRNTEPYFCEIRPKVGDEVPGLYRYSENPLYRKIVLPVESKVKAA